VTLSSSPTITFRLKILKLEKFKKQDFKGWDSNCSLSSAYCTGGNPFSQLTPFNLFSSKKVTPYILLFNIFCC
jgi:hypothetical protein